MTSARDQLGDIAARAAYAGERTYLTRHGKRVAAIIPAALLEEIEAEEDAEDVAAAELRPCPLCHASLDSAAGRG